MERRIYHGDITPTDVAQALMAEFNQGNLQTQLVGESKNLTVQIASAQFARSGGKTAMTINIQQVEDGVMIQIGEQQWLGVAASLGQSALSALLNPWNLIGRLDDIAQDVSNLQLNEKVWAVVAAVTRAKGASTELSERLTRLTCEFCGSANPVGEPNCVACGAPLGKAHPTACPKCGFAIQPADNFCPNCGQPV
jgi:hypothetical protein